MKSKNFIVATIVAIVFVIIIIFSGMLISEIIDEALTELKETGGIKARLEELWYGNPK